jgi:hypothetical protein
MTKKAEALLTHLFNNFVKITVFSEKNDQPLVKIDEEFIGF